MVEKVAIGNTYSLMFFMHVFNNVFYKNEEKHVF